MTDSPAYVLPVIFTAAYQTCQYGSKGGIYSVGADPTVFSYLVNPPATGVDAADDSTERAEALGAKAVVLDNQAATLGGTDVATAHAATTYQYRTPPKNVTARATSHSDSMVNFYDSASIGP